MLFKTLLEFYAKWINNPYLKVDGYLEWYKARLVTKGYSQKYGVDYETFSHVIRMTTSRTIISLVDHRRWYLYQLDVNNAFLQSDLQEEVYIKPPEGLNVDPCFQIKEISTRA